MGAKDKSTKYLEAYNDVFADIFNVLVFESIYVDEHKLTDGATETQYKTETETLQSQYRDCLKQYMDANMVCVSMGLENQTTVDQTMPVRIMGYDYGRYALQLQNGDKISPVISLILYFGEEEWTTPLSLIDMMEDIPTPVREHLIDYPIHVVNIKHLPKSVRKQFKSDFGVVADYFAEKDSEDFIPSNKELKHGEAVMHMLKVFTGDDRYDSLIDMVKADIEKGKVITMCSYLDKLENRGMEKGLKNLLRTLKCLLTDFDDIYEYVIMNEDYKDRTKEEIQELLEQV